MPKSLSRRDFLKLGGAAMLSVALPGVTTLSVEPFDPSVIYHGSRKLPRLAMTFDDCWHPEVLDALSTMLKPYPDFHFTFFAIGDAIKIDEALKPGIWKRLYDEGHEVGYHTSHHDDPQRMSLDKLMADHDEWMQTMQRALGFAPRVHFARPPYDNLSLSFQELCIQRGMVATMYSTGFEAPKMDDSMLLASRAVNGDIVQMHTYQDPPHGRFDVDITAKVVPYFAERGFTLVTMTQLYDDLLQQYYSSDGCAAGLGSSPTRTCLQ